MTERALRNAVKRTKVPLKSMRDFFRPCSLWTPVGDAALNINKMRGDQLTGILNEQFALMEDRKPRPFMDKLALPTSYNGTSAGR
jgi:hypothetical protein